MIINWDETHKRVVDLLADKRLPQHYKQCYHETVRLSSNGDYSDKTKPIEKFRQYYGEHYRSDVGLTQGGYLILRRWFPKLSQYSLLPPEQPLALKGNCILSYQAGYEYARREPYMMDHYGDANTPKRQERRRRGMLVEAHVKRYFERHYPEFYRPASNQGLYHQAAKDDFWLIGGRFNFPVDVKSWSYQDDSGYDVAVIRNPDNRTIYIYADWQDNETVVIQGISIGGWVKIIGGQNGEVYHVSSNHILSVEVLLVMLNMARSDMDYRLFRDNIYAGAIAK